MDKKAKKIDADEFASNVIVFFFLLLIVVVFFVIDYTSVAGDSVGAPDDLEEYIFVGDRIYERSEVDMLLKNIKEDEAVETCAMLVNRFDGAMIYSTQDASERDKIVAGADAWIIELEGSAKNNGTWESAMFYCEVPFERKDVSETYSVKNVRKIEYLGR